MLITCSTAPFQQPPTPSPFQQLPCHSCSLSGCGSHSPHHLCGSTGTCSSSDCHTLKQLKSEKGHTGSPHYYDQTGGSEKSKGGIYAEMLEWTGPFEGQRELYQELKLGAMKERQRCPSPCNPALRWTSGLRPKTG